MYPEGDAGLQSCPVSHRGVSSAGRAERVHGVMAADDENEKEQEHADLAQARQGDGEAFGRLVARHQRMVFALALRMTGSPAEADDVTQQAFLNAFRSLASFRGEAAFKTWLYEIARNECRMHYRRGRRLVVTDEVPEIDPDGWMGEEDGDGISRRFLSSLVDRLPQKQRAAVLLRVRDDLSFREIGLMLGSSDASAKVNFFHAMKKLRTWVREEENG